uniref:30S ribosomal protein S18 n=1 Tax=Sporochnus bolleanus TaxID=461143 RepID=UPI002E7A2596|nr:30S ribosomal protein S18 [Sporochnus bolleanus]WAM64873.1 30S ribosomal protein S18 [Sporochnus bolleanus]
MPNTKNKENIKNKRNTGNSKNSGKPAKTRRQPFKLKPNEVIDYKQVDILLSFSTENGKIKSRRSTNLTLKQQRQLSKSIKRARYLRLLPFVTSVEN